MTWRDQKVAVDDDYCDGDDAVVMDDAV